MSQENKKRISTCQCELCGTSFTSTAHKKVKYCPKCNEGLRNPDSLYNKRIALKIAKNTGAHTPDSNVHHRDGDKLNNSPENLTILSNSDHSKLHAAANLERTRAAQQGKPVKNLKELTDKYIHTHHVPYFNCTEDSEQLEKEYREKEAVEKGFLKALEEGY